MRNLYLPLVTLVLAGVFAVPGGLALNGSTPTDSGTLEVRFIYLPPAEHYPTYHTAIWLEDAAGEYVKTLFVSQELSATEYKLGTACPSWIEKASWPEAEEVVDAVSAPTPLMGGDTLTFDLAALGVSPGTYRFRFEVHYHEDYNTSFTGVLNVGTEYMRVNLDKEYLPTEADTEVVRDVRVQYYPPEVQAGG